MDRAIKTSATPGGDYRSVSAVVGWFFAKKAGREVGRVISATNQVEPTV